MDLHINEFVETSLNYKEKNRERDLGKEIVANFTSGASLPPAGIRVERHNKTLHLDGKGLSGACTLERRSAEESRLCQFTNKVLPGFST